MSPAAQEVLRAWSFPIWANLAVVLTAIVYVQGWWALRKSSGDLFRVRHLATFLAGLFCLWIAIGSPLAAFDDVSLTVHMVQHLLLMAVVPPLVLLGAPALPLLHGLPQWVVRRVVGPLFRGIPVQPLGHFLSHPAVCWIAAAVALIGWHIPSAFGLALDSEFWHEVEHICFLSTSILFWWPVIQPFPSEPVWPRWTIPLYLFFGMMPGGALGAFLCFSDRVLYPAYAAAPNLFGMTPMGDQVFAGALMWVFGTFVYLAPAAIITVQLLSPQPRHQARETTFSPRETADHPA
jgi:putative membrane protein